MSLSRREFVALMLGAPALMSAGCSDPVRLPPKGALLGQSFDIGHRLRDGFRPRPEQEQWHDVSVVIVGGGAAGLSAAWRLKRAGHSDFVLLELESTPGGTSRSGTCPISPYPWGAHYVPVPFAENRRLIELLTDMGVVESLDADGAPNVGEQYLCREPEERLFFQGQWIEGLYPATDATPDDLAELAAFRKEIDRWSEWRDKQGRRAFAIPTSHASDDAQVLELDRLSMSDWLRRQGWTSHRLHWLVDYSCRDDYGQTAEQTSAWAGILYFAARQQGPGVEHQPLITWPEGNGRIIFHLSQAASKQVRTGMAVTQIVPAKNATEPIEVVCFNTQSHQVTGYRARHVIFAAPLFLAPRLIDDFTKRTGRQTHDFTYGSWLVANLQLSDRPREGSYPLCWDNVIYDSPSLGYVVATHQSGRDHGPAVLTWYYPYAEIDVRSVREQLLTATWEDLAEVVLTDLERAHPDIRDLTERLDIFRWGHAMIRPRVGFITSPQRKAAAVPVGGIHFANTDLSGIALLEEAFDHGCRAADEVLKALA